MALRSKNKVVGRPVLPALALAVALLPPSALAQDAPTASICAMAASSQYEPGYQGFGRELNRIDPATAIPACEEAVKAAPDVAANQAWLARALLADGQTDAALPLLETAVAGDSPLGRQLLADVLFGDLGYVGTTDEARALEVLRPAAEAGFAPAQLSLGFAYDLGRGLDEDNLIAASWYMRAAQQGEPRSASNLGYLYHGGAGVDLDYAQAMFWYQTGADKGDVVGIYGVGQLYEFGQGVEVDFVKAAEQFQRGAELGDSYSQNDLGYLYETGQGVSEDAAEAARYYQMAADQGYALASANLGQLYSTGRGVERDFDRAFELYSYAHDQGEIGGTVGLAQAYLYGEGVPVDLETARSFAEQAADAGASYGQSTLGAIYADGSGVARDFNRAIELFDLAAAQGNDYAASRAAEVRAEQTCGLIAATRYETGFEVSGVELERIHADTAIPVCEKATALDAASLENKAWYARTLIAGGRAAEAVPLLEEAAGAFTPANVLLADLLLWGHGVDENPARAVTLYQAAAAENFPPAEFGLGVAYQNGRGVPADPALAAKWYGLAAKHGVAAAADRLADLDRGTVEPQVGPMRAGPRS
ncbi:tetratricopeptide repeat protein [Devosia insulae]|uniref:tetratricopeptide repeat protein n=1 Tax=Devosia insulae TaxID=408174 RepID=UPI00159F3344|nr:tetratricopeptide repeat protein [Devosia insulae]